MQTSDLKKLLVLVAAPMAGISTPIFRTLCREWGATFAFTEMVSAKGLCHADKKTLAFLEKDDSPSETGVQIFGADPGVMARAARIVEKAGFRMVDVNMGCPVRKVVSNGSGAALMREPARACEIVSAIRGNVSIPVTAKIRSGWDRKNINAPEIAPRLEEAGLDAVTIHARTRGQGYSGRADWSVISRVVRSVSIPVVGNGDVRDGDSALRLLAETGCHGIMVGRGSLGKPWIFGEIARSLEANHPLPFRPAAEERYHVFLRHLRGVRTESGRRAGLRRFRNCAAWYTKGYPGATEARRTIMKALSSGEVIKTLKSLYFRTEPGH